MKKKPLVYPTHPCPPRTSPLFTKFSDENLIEQTWPGDNYCPAPAAAVYIKHKIPIIISTKYNIPNTRFTVQNHKNFDRTNQGRGQLVLQLLWFSVSTIPRKISGSRLLSSILEAKPETGTNFEKFLLTLSSPLFLLTLSSPLCNPQSSTTPPPCMCLLACLSF